MKHYNAKEADAAQTEYCRKCDLPKFAPRRICWRCGRDIYTAISVEEAGHKHITACPHCRASYCD